jgi:HK97 family phage portal protein
LELAGNSYWLLDGVKSDTDKPTAIYILNPRHTNPIPAKLPEFLKGYKYSLNGETQEFKPYQVLHFKYPDPNDQYQGIGTVQAIIDWIQTDNFANEVNMNYFKNGARLGGLLSSENAITDAQMKVLRASFENLYKGAGNAYRVAVLPKGVKYDEASSTPKDMDFANMQSVMRDKILSGFRVPKTILGSSESETNRATAETSNYVFAARTLKPKLELIVQQLNEFLVPRYGDNLYLDFTDPVPEDRAQRIEEMKAATGLQPVISVNEAREEYFGLDGVDKGDNVMTDFSKIPLGKPKPKEIKRMMPNSAAPIAYKAFVLKFRPIALSIF